MAAPNKKTCRAVAAAVAASLALMGRSGAAGINDAAIFGALPHVSEAAISPDGRTIAQLQALGGGRRAVVFVDVDGKTAPVGMELENAKARDLRWAGDDHVMLLVSGSIEESFGDGLKTYELWRWFIIDRQAKTKSIPFRAWRRGVFYFGSGDIECFGGDDPSSIVMGHQNPHSLFSINLANGSEKLLQRGEAATYDWVLNSDCEPVLRLDYDASKEEIRFFAAKSGGGYEFKSAIKSKRGDYLTIRDVGLEAATGAPVALALDGDVRALRRLDLDAGALKAGGENAGGFDLSATVIDPFSDRIVGVRYVDDFPRARFFAEPLAGLQQKASGAFKGASAVITSWSRDYARLVVEVTYADHPPQNFLFEPASKSMTVVGSTYPKLDGQPQPIREKFDYVASDGVKAPGYLTVPVNAASGPHPLIVLPHGGPAARDHLGFDWWASFYAANGYLVYQPNFRGSFGYGATFREAGDGQWGRKMQDDISEGVRKLIADGRADGARVCIVGASYGGYAALAGATLTPDLYACAVSVNGISNLPAIIASESDSVEKFWTKRIGSIFKDKDAIAAVSPSKQVSKATPPVMLIQSTDDIVVPPGQSVIMRKALEDARRPVVYATLKGEDHWLSHEKTRVEMLDVSLAFINTHIGPK